ncbi:baseplate J/gp47 family protein [Dyella flagellata]|uniref:Baseplate protein J-like domain-containing protein n=1 Tax=Dyella flagellata TaxID=1867833 RepID=A0ABQ5X866_9GAMM|nr:hypothetical protein [Dyella flagellata]GLQ87809.1 hypothetical protein GCM10007898_13770 [Dyella flagellata]
MSAGTQQDQRLAAALRPGYIVPDEFTLAERIRLTLGYAAQLRFATRDGSDAGCWDDALRRDESALLADIASFPLAGAQEGFAQAWPWAGERHLWWRVRQLLFRFDDWCQWLARHETPTATQLLQAMMAAVGSGLRDGLQEAVRCFGLEQVEARRLHSVWRMDANSEVVVDLDGDARQRMQLLRRLWGALCLAIARLRPLAQAQLPASMLSGKHEPAIGLLLAALQLYQDTRAVVNRFPERVTDFYYLDLLRMQPRPPAHERVYLRFERDPRFATAVQVARGACFVGGKDSDGKMIEFAAEQALEVTDSVVAALYSVRLERDALISPEKDFAYATRVMAQAIPLLPPDAAYVENPPWWPLLGGHAKASAATAQNATLGFALASTMLALKEGDRRVNVLLRLSHPANDDEALASLLRCNEQQRDAAWLGRVFALLDRSEARHHPIRRAATDAASVEQRANAAWSRAPRPTGDVRLCYLLANCLATDDVKRFRENLGRLFAVWLIAGSEELHPLDVDALRKHAAGLPGNDGPAAVEIDDPLILIHPHEHDDGDGAGHGLPDRGLIFERVFRGVWRAEFSVAGGWLVPGDVLVRRRSDAGFGFGGCIELLMHVGQEQPPIVPCKTAVHGDMWPAQPALRLTLQNRTRLYAYSLLQQLILHDIVLSTQVTGVRDIVLYNQLGRLDAGKPFLPFGPIPALGAYCLFGNEELAAKPLRALRVNLRWGQLPSEEGGFATRYHGYPGEWSAAGFQVRPELLRDGQWRGGSSASLGLFRGERHLQDTITLSLPETDLALYHRPQMRVPEPFVYGTTARNGFFRLELCAPGVAFGHALYPRLLSEALTINARLKRAKLKVPLPQEPYTPAVEQISLDYLASQRISLKQMAQASSPGRLFHLHPFGHDNPRARPGMDGVPLLPRYFNDGNLYIGLSGSDPSGALSMYFHLRPESAEECWQAALPQLSWAVWCEQGWRTLETDRTLSDGTLGFLRSGIVLLDLPDGMKCDCSQLPGRLYWLRLSGDGVLERLAGLYGVYTQAVTARRVHSRRADEPCTSLPPGTIRTPLHPIGGLRTVQQVGPSFGLGQPEAADMLRVRSAERLRHKNRASTPWDYERLLLDAFPTVYKVKCFANGEAPTAALSGEPGGVLVVVVPAPRQGVLFHSTEAPRFDAAVLEEMAARLRERSTPGIRIVVRNAVYERIQVRCSLRLARGVHPGAALIRINQAIVEFLSPWHTDGCRANFDWDVRAEAIEARLRQLDEVDVVGAMSLLHIVRSDGNTYQLLDTARSRDGAAVRQVRPVQPWSLVLPTARHLIELIGVPSTRGVQATGVGKLEIGGTFILGSAPPATGRGAP